MTEKLTALDLKQCTMREIGHLNGGPVFYGYIFQCREHPRLQRVDKTYRKTKKTEIRYRVDGEPVASLEEAAERLSFPPVITPEMASALDLIESEYADWREIIGYTTLRKLCDCGLIEMERGKARRVPS